MTVMGSATHVHDELANLRRSVVLKQLLSTPTTWHLAAAGEHQVWLGTNIWQSMNWPRGLAGFILYLGAHELNPKNSSASPSTLNLQSLPAAGTGQAPGAR
jgi:hypothetical protein